MASRSGTEGPDLKVGLTSLLDSETRPATYDGPPISISGFLAHRIPDDLVTRGRAPPIPSSLTLRIGLETRACGLGIERDEPQGQD